MIARTANTPCRHQPGCPHDLGPGHGMTHMRTLAAGGCLIQAEALRQEAALRIANRAAQTVHAQRAVSREAYNRAQRDYYARQMAERQSHPRCLNCGCDDAALIPSGRTRADGTRAPMRYCSPCLARRSEGVVLAEGGRDAKLRARRSYRVREACA